MAASEQKQSYTRLRTGSGASKGARELIKSADLSNAPTTDLNALIGEVRNILRSRALYQRKYKAHTVDSRKDELLGKITGRRNQIKRKFDLSLAEATYEDFGGRGIGTTLTPEIAATRLAAFTVDDDSTDWINSPVLGVTEVAHKLGVVRTTVDNWRKKNHVIALRHGPRNFLFPERQFLKSHPVDGIKDVLSHFPDQEEAWEWLVIENPHTNEEAPIDRLRKGHVEEVVRAAEGAMDYA